MMKLFLCEFSLLISYSRRECDYMNVISSIILFNEMCKLSG